MPFHYIDLHLMSRIPDHGTLLRKRVKRMTWNEPGCFNVVFRKHLQEPADTDSASKETLKTISETVSNVVRIAQWTS